MKRIKRARDSETSRQGKAASKKVSAPIPYPAKYAYPFIFNIKINENGSNLLEIAAIILPLQVIEKEINTPFLRVLQD